MRDLFVTLLFVSAMSAGGCHRSESPHGSWMVIDTGIPMGMEEAEAIDTGEIWVVEWYGMPIRKGKREAHLLWTNQATNPYGLQPGDRFRFSDKIDEQYFDEMHNGYYVDAGDIVGD